MDLIITILPVVSKDLPISPRFTPYDFLSRCKFSNLTTGPVQRLGGGGDVTFPPPVFGGDGTKIALTGNIFDQPPGGMG